MSGPPDVFELSQGERHSPLWLRLKAHWMQQLENARLRNDGPLDAAATAALRGEIRCLKQLITLGDDRPVTGDVDAP